MPKGKEHTPEQIVAILRRIEQGEAVEAVCRSVNISEATLYRWKQQYGAMELDEVKEHEGAARRERASETAGRRSGAEHPGAEGSELKKMVSPSQRRHAAESVVAAGLCSSRQACRYLGLARSSLAYRRKPPTERRAQTEAAIVELSRRHPRYGYRRVHAMVLRRGLSCARRTVQRVRRREGLRVLGPARRPRCPARSEAKIKAEGVNDVWCVDLVFDATRHGVTLKFLTIVDEGSHYCIDIAVGRRMTARDVVRALDEAVRRHGKPRHLRSDNGGEFIAGVLQPWLKERGIVARFIEPGSPWQNGVNESFKGRFRDECLNRELLESALEAQVIARAFRDEYNDIRPHSSLDYRAPSEVRVELLKQAPGSGQARQAGPSLRPELASADTTNP